MPAVVEVVAAVVERDGRYLITRRLEGTHLAGLWEFPGGKILPGEKPEDALRRELQEELGVEAEVGELIGVFQSGAYARTASPLGFLSHPTPAEVLVEHGHARLIRRRGTYEDLFYDMPQVPRT